MVQVSEAWFYLVNLVASFIYLFLPLKTYFWKKYFFTQCQRKFLNSFLIEKNESRFKKIKSINFIIGFSIYLQGWTFSWNSPLFLKKIIFWFFSLNWGKNDFLGKRNIFWLKKKMLLGWINFHARLLYIPVYIPVYIYPSIYIWLCSRRRTLRTRTWPSRSSGSRIRWWRGRFSGKNIPLTTER